MKKVQFYILLICALCFAASASAQTSPFWGNLKKGSYAVGFKTYRKPDYARAVRPDLNYDGTSFQGERARVIDFSIWFPSAKNASRQMIYEDYLFAASAQPLTEERKKSIRENFKARNGGEKAEEILKMPVETLFSSAPAEGKFPLVIGVTVSRTLAEYLASYGYVVAVASSASPTENTLIDYVGDLEFGLRELRDNPQIDFSRIGATGFSASAGVAALFQIKTGNVGAVVSFDGTEGWNQWREQISRESYFRPESANVPYLRFHDAEHSASDINFSFFYEKAQFMELVRIDYKIFGHRDMESAIFDRLMPGENAKDDFLQYQKMLGEYTLNFFDAHLKKKPEGAAFLKRLPEENGFTKDFISVTRKTALPRPPSRVEIMEIVEREGGIETLLKINQNLKKSMPQPFAENLLRSLLLVYNRQRRHDVAAGLANLMLENYPELCTTYYFAGIAFKDANQTDAAIKAFEKYFEIEKTDKATSDATKERLRGLARENLNQLKK